MTTALRNQDVSSAATSSSSFRANNRCAFASPAGYQCRSLAGFDHPTLCTRHAQSAALAAANRAQLAHSGASLPPAHNSNADADVTAELLGPIENFRTAVAVNHTLGKLLVLLAGNRISPRRGATLAYTCQLLLQSVAAVDKELWPTGAANDIMKEARSLLRATSTLRNDDANDS